MDLQLVFVILGLARTISTVAWTGSIIFILTVPLPVLSKLQGNVRVESNARFYHLSENYLRACGILTLIFGIVVYAFPYKSITNVIMSFDPLNVFFIVVITAAAYAVVGEGYLFRKMNMYWSISDSLDQKEKGQDIAHMIILERNISRLMILQLSLLIVLIIANSYFPFSYYLP